MGIITAIAVILVQMGLSIVLLIWNAAFLGFAGEAHRSDKQNMLGLMIAILSNGIALLPLIVTLLLIWNRWSDNKLKLPLGNYLPFVLVVSSGLICFTLLKAYDKLGYDKISGNKGLASAATPSKPNVVSDVNTKFVSLSNGNSIPLKHLPMVKSVTDVYRHHFPAGSEMAKKGGPGISQKKIPAGTLLRIPPPPGGKDEWIYIISPDGKFGALEIGPLHGFLVEWDEIRIGWK